MDKATRSMKPYTYTIYKHGQPPIVKTVTEPGGPAPPMAPTQEYKSVSEQLHAETWDVRDFSVRNPRSLNHAVEHSGIAQGGRSWT